MEWMRIETDRPSRLLAPSQAPPPSLEGIDKLFQPPLNIRSIATSAPILAAAASSRARGSFAQQKATIFSFPNEEKLGTVSVACGGELVGSAACAACALVALTCMRSCNSQSAQAVCDFLCVVPSTLDEAAAQAKAAALDDEDDGFAAAAAPQRQPATGTSGNRFFLPEMMLDSAFQRGGEERQRQPAARFRTDETAGAARSLICHFVTGGAMPLSAVFCAWSHQQQQQQPAGNARALHAPSFAALQGAQASCKDVADLVKALGLTKKLSRALVNVESLWRHICGSLTAASNDGVVTDHALSPFCAATHFGAVFSPAGLVVASEHFFDVTSHWERVVLATMAFDHLLSKSASSTAASIRCLEVPFLLSIPRAVSQLIIVSVGRCLSVVIGFRFAKQTPQVPVNCHAVAADYARFIAGLAEEKSGGSQPPVLDAMLGRVKQQTRDAKYEAVCGDLQLAGFGGTSITSSDGDDDGDGATCGCVVTNSAKQKKKRREASQQADAALPFGLALCKYAVKIRRAETGLLANLGHADAPYPLLAHVAGQSSVPWLVRCAAQDSSPSAPVVAAVAEYTHRTAFVTSFAKLLPSDASARRVVEALRTVGDVLDPTDDGRAVCAIVATPSASEDLGSHDGPAGGVLSATAAAHDREEQTITTAVAEQRAARVAAGAASDADGAVYASSWRCTLIARDAVDDLPPAVAGEGGGGGAWATMETVLRLHCDALLSAAMNEAMD